MTHALRLWRRQPILALAAIVSLALGIGANTAIFSVLNAVVLRPLPFPDADRLVVAWETSADNPTRWVAPANFLDWQREARSFTSMAAFGGFAANLTGLGEPERLRAAGASGTFFSTLGVQAAVGRTLVPSDDAPGAPAVAVLTDGLARRLFGTSSAALGRELTLEGRPHAIVGVMPATFAMPMVANAEVWLGSDRGIPRSFPFPGDITAVRDSHILYVVGRLADGATREVARQELASIMGRLARTYPDTNEGLGATVVGLHEQVVGDVRPLVVLLQLAVALMLAIGCANVANLILGQVAGRQGELAMRVALGASRGRLVRQLLAETMVIAVPGGILGLLLAAWGLDALVALAPAELPRAGEIAMDGTTLAFTLAVTLATALAFGIGPALSRSRASVADATAQSQRVAGNHSVRRWHQVMAVGELALAQVLLVGAGLLLASFLAAQRVELGFVPEGRIAADLSLAPDRYARPRAGSSPDDFRVDIEPKRQLVDQVLTRLRNTPGVRAAAAAFTAPMAGAPNRGIALEGQDEKLTVQGPSADFQVVTPDYFRALGITFVRGRAFDDSDREGRPPVVIVNQAFVDRFMPGRDPLGRMLMFGGDRRHEIVGIVANTRYRDVERAAEPTFYIPLHQNDERWPFLSFTVWFDDASTRGAGGDVRSAGASAPASPSTIASAIRSAVREADPNQPVARIRTYDELLASALASRRFNTLLVGVFSLTALLLAALGTYGVMAYGVASRTRELGVRAALGASPTDLRRMVLRQGAWLSGAAVVMGLGVAWLATQSMAALLFEVRPGDPWTFAAVAAVLSSVALLATWLPARAATRVDPIRALREQ
jgi:putative ABC transport system permease protein